MLNSSVLLSSSSPYPEIDDYVHRIGRTGRCGNQGRAVAFFDPSQPEDSRLASSLCHQMKLSETEAIPQWLLDVAGIGSMGGGGGGLNPRQDLRGKLPAKAAAGSANDEDWE